MQGGLSGFLLEASSEARFDTSCEEVEDLARYYIAALSSSRIEFCLNKFTKLLFGQSPFFLLSSNRPTCDKS